VTTRVLVLARGDLTWLFPTLTDPAEHNRVRELLEAADDAFYRSGKRLGAQPDAQLWDVPLNRFYYQRLGPGPVPPVAILVGEGGTDRIRTQVLLTPAGHGPYLRPGPPWQADARVFLRCDSADPGCGEGHVVDARTSPPALTPVAAAVEVRAATEWLLRRLANETESSLRAQDPDRGHPPAPQRVD
jgi:hypothetical protein